MALPQRTAAGRRGKPEIFMKNKQFCCVSFAHWVVSPANIFRIRSSLGRVQENGLFISARMLENPRADCMYRAPEQAAQACQRPDDRKSSNARRPSPPLPYRSVWNIIQDGMSLPYVSKFSSGHSPPSATSKSRSPHIHATRRSNDLGNVLFGRGGRRAVGWGRESSWLS